MTFFTIKTFFERSSSQDNPDEIIIQNLVKELFQGILKRSGGTELHRIVDFLCFLTSLASASSANSDDNDKHQFRLKSIKHLILKVLMNYERINLSRMFLSDGQRSKFDKMVKDMNCEGNTGIP